MGETERDIYACQVVRWMTRNRRLGLQKDGVLLCFLIKICDRISGKTTNASNLPEIQGLVTMTDCHGGRPTTWVNSVLYYGFHYRLHFLYQLESITINRGG